MHYGYWPGLLYPLLTYTLDMGVCVASAGGPRIVHINLLSPYNGDNHPTQHKEVGLKDFRWSYRKAVALSGQLPRPRSDEMRVSGPLYLTDGLRTDPVCCPPGSEHVKSNCECLPKEIRAHTIIGVPGVLHLTDEGRYRFYLATERWSHVKPTNWNIIKW